MLFNYIFFPILSHHPQDYVEVWRQIRSGELTHIEGGTAFSSGSVNFKKTDERFLHLFLREDEKTIAASDDRLRNKAWALRKSVKLNDDQTDKIQRFANALYAIEMAKKNLGSIYTHDSELDHEHILASCC